MIPCEHAYSPSDVADYEVCRLCGTYHSLRALPAKAIYGARYWNRAGHSTIREQVHNVDVHEECGKSKNAFVLDRIDVSERRAALEIACAPGSLLRRLREDAGFDEVLGIDVDATYKADIREIAGPEPTLVFGYFPKVTARMPGSRFDLIVGCDIFEHVHEPAAFLSECVRLLDRRGQLLLMMPIVDYERPPDRFFFPQEHVYMHSVTHIRMLFEWAGFEDVHFGQWTAGHETVTARRA